MTPPDPLTTELTLNHRQVLVAEVGDPAAQPVIFVHGFRGDHHGLLGIAQALVVRHPEVRVLIPDLPGFGESAPLAGPHHLNAYGDWLRTFAGTVAPDGSVLLAHSFGTLVAASAIANGYAPKQVALVNPISAPALSGPRRALSKLTELYYELGAKLPERAAEPLLANPGIVRVMSEVMTKTRDPRLRRWIHEQHAAYFSGYANREVLREAFEASVSHTVGEFAAAFTMPTVVVAGERDDIAPLVHQLDLYRKLSHRVRSELLTIPGVGHLTHYEAPDEVAEHVGRFWGAQG